MPFNLPILESQRSLVSADQFAQLNEMFKQNTCKPLADYLIQLSDAEKRVSVCEIALEYAIEQGAHGFIHDLLSYEIVMSHVSHFVLFQYALKQDLNFQKLALSAMAEYSSHHFLDIINNFSLEKVHKEASCALFETAPLQAIDKTMAKQIMQIFHANLTWKSSLLLNWVNEYYKVLINAKNKQAIIDTFLDHLPQHDEKSLVTTMIYIVTGNIRNQSNGKKSLITTMIHIVTENIWQKNQNHADPVLQTMGAFLARYPLNHDQLVCVLEGVFAYSSSPSLIHLSKLLEQLDPNHPSYQHFKLVYEFFSLDLKKHENGVNFIMAHPDIMTSEFLPKTIKDTIIYGLGEKAWKIFIEKYIDDPLLAWGHMFSLYLFQLRLSEEDQANIITRYLNAAHVKLSDNFPEKLINCFSSHREKLIALLVQRKDCSFDKSFYRPLLKLFQEGDAVSIKHLLSHPNVFELLKNFYNLRGNDELSWEDRGTLMPKVLAWYASSPEKFQELYAVVPEQARNELLKTGVPALIDSSQPTLRSYILKVGTPEMIEGVGGFHPRFFRRISNEKSVVVVPSIWRQGKSLEALRQFQRLYANYFAQARTEQLKLITSPEDVQHIAQKAARACQVDTLTLQHETTVSNATNVLLSGRLRSKQHIQGHSITGKASQGFTNKNLPLSDFRSAFTFATRISTQDKNHSETIHLLSQTKTNQARFIFNGRQLLDDNTHITFLIIGVYPFFGKKTLKLPGKYTLISENIPDTVVTTLRYKLIDNQGYKVNGVHFTEISEGTDLIRIPLGYDLALMSNDKLEPRKLYIETTEVGLRYKVVGLDETPKEDTIPWDKLQKFPPNALAIIESKGSFLPQILEITSKAGHTLPLSTQADETLRTIHQKMFELILLKLVYPLPEPLRKEVIQKLIEPQTLEDHTLIRNFLDFLSLEWMIPGDIRLSFSSLEQIKYGESTYHLSALRHAVLNEKETNVLEAIRAVNGLECMPSILDGILSIALKRNQRKVVSEVFKFQKKVKPNDSLVYYPDEIYQIESLVQLMLEDLDTKEQTYVHYFGEKLFITTLLRKHTNRGGVHHAEMPKLHCALGMLKNANSESALQIVLEDTLTLVLGENTPFLSLSAVRDALLTYEITTLLASQQNTDFFIATKGNFHPKTGKGATNGEIALMENRLFIKDEPYRINVVCDAEAKQICVQSSKPHQAYSIAATLSHVLDISAEKINADQNNGKVVIKITPCDLIAKLRQRAICYEGINVLTAGGHLLLAKRHGKGLASAGGHHSNKYSSKDVAYGLKSEFGLQFKEPHCLEQQVTILGNVKTISKTGIYILSADALEPTKKALSYAETHSINIPFQADPDEFEPGSEVALTLVQMRGQRFYDVMPLAELCQYQFMVLKNYLKEQFPNEYEQMTFDIDDHCQCVLESQVAYKVPSSTFGQIKVTIKGKLPDPLQNVFDKMAAQPVTTIQGQVYVFDESPLAVKNEIASQNVSQLRLSCS